MFASQVACVCVCAYALFVGRALTPAAWMRAEDRSVLRPMLTYRAAQAQPE